MDINENSDKSALIALIAEYEKKIIKLDAFNFQLRNLVDGLPGDLYWKNSDGLWTGMNERCAQSLCRMGFIKEPSQSAVIGKTDYEIFDSKTADIYRQNDLDVMEKQIELSIEENTTLLSGEKVTLLSTKSPLWDKDGKVVGIVGNTVDISFLKKIEAELKIAKEKAEAASQAKTEFIANMSHDIRTPLSGVVGMSKLLEDGAYNDEQRQYAQWVNESGEQLLGLLNGILDVVSAEHINESDVREETFDLRQCINDIVKLELPTTKLKGLDLRVEITDTVPLFIVSDRSKLHRILLNILGNAIKFTAAGYISIEVLPLMITGEYTRLRFRVVDTGIGIPLALQDKVFDRFFRATPSYKGVYAGHGVGLHIARSYVNLLGGTIQLTSEESVGTTFYFDVTFRIGCKENVSPRLIAAHEDPLGESGKLSSDLERGDAAIGIIAPNLLLVEDNSIALRMAEMIAYKAGCQFSLAVDGEQALELARSTAFDLVITDIGLPGISGYELTHYIREWEASQNRKPVPIIGLTAHVPREAKEECIKSGMSNVFSKPLSLPMLQKIINQFSLLNNKLPNDDIPKANSNIGADLPNTEEQLFEINEFSLFDMNSAIESIGNQDMVREIMTLLIQQQIPADIAGIKQAHEQNNWENVAKLVHKMKGGAVYCGTIRMKFACQYLERYQKAGNTVMLNKLYKQLIQVVEDTRQFVEKWLQS